MSCLADSVAGVTMSATGFVTFKDMASVACAVRAPLRHNPDVLTVMVAPEPRDIKWENAHINLSWSSGRAVTANALLCLGVSFLSFYLLPIFCPLFIAKNAPFRFALQLVCVLVCLTDIFLYYVVFPLYELGNSVVHPCCWHPGVSSWRCFCLRVCQEL